MMMDEKIERASAIFSIYLLKPQQKIFPQDFIMFQKKTKAFLYTTLE